MASLNDFLPNPRVQEYDEVQTCAPAASAFEVAHHFDLARSPWVKALFWARLLPERLAGGEAIGPAPDLHVDAIGKDGQGFMVLEQTPNHLIVGAIGRFWQPHIEFAQLKPGEFASFSQPGWGKVAWELRADPEPRGCRLGIEVRVSATDERSWQALSRYYRVLGPFSRFIRRQELQLIARELGGETDLERQQPLVGDGIIARPKASATDSILIDAPPEAIWPWLVQIGCQRAGWYSHDLLDNGGKPSAFEIVPALQKLAVGDVIPARPEGDTGFTVLALEPQHALVLGGLFDTERERPLPMAADKPAHFWQATWAFVLEPAANQHTRLWVRARVDHAFGDGAQHRRLQVLSLVHAFMERAQLQNLKARVEGRATPPSATLRDVAESTVGAFGIAFDLVTPFLRGVRSHWGLTAQEAACSYAGDQLVPEPRWQWTHGIEIDAAPDAVWPWVAQLGQEKGGFYSYQALENLVGCEIQNAERVHLEWSYPAPGDAVRIHPKAPALLVREIVASRRMLVCAGMDPRTGVAPKPTGQRYVAVSWLFELQPLASGRTRLISRYRCACSSDLATRLAYGPYIAESMGFVMDRRMLLGIQERAERARPTASASAARAESE